MVAAPPRQVYLWFLFFVQNSWPNRLPKTMYSIEGTATLKSHLAPIVRSLRRLDLSATSDGQCVVASGWDGAVHIWRLKKSA